MSLIDEYHLPFAFTMKKTIELINENPFKYTRQNLGQG
ncbi:hypothetical protein YN1HA_24860 [Sulfurisphaera ohwakuensis]